MGCFSPLLGYKDPDHGGLAFKRTARTKEKMAVACGQCLGCRVDRTLMWAMRITHESDLHESAAGNCFITLTYRDKHECTEEQLANGYFLPHPPTLIKSHFQDFMKRLRKEFPQKIRYFHCGEYGDETSRPHYHACLFNVSFPDQALWKDNEGMYTFHSPTLEKLWPYGFSTIGELNFDTAAYTAGYVLKKVTGINAPDHYEYIDDETGEISWLLPEYVTMSLKPGIGHDFYKQNKSDFLDDLCPVLGKGVRHKLPRYYQNLLEASDPEKLEAIKAIRQKYFREHESEFSPERLMDKYNVLKARQSLKEKTL